MAEDLKRRKLKAVIVGGSIAGISCAHALTSAGWDVVILEKSSGILTGSPTGAGLGLDPLSQALIKSWLPQPQLLDLTTLPLTIDLNKTTDSESKLSRTLTRDDNFNFRTAHWQDLRGLLYNVLPPHKFLWSHRFLSFCVSDDKASVEAKAKVLQTDETVSIVGDLLIAADGSLSSIRHTFLPNFKLRYSGYCAWRGVLDFSENEDSETITGIRKAYPELGKCLYFDLGSGTHMVLYELPNKKMNWLWYVNQPEPELKGNSVTIKVSSDMIPKMHEEAEKRWIPELVRVIKETKDPFINVIYDSDPIERLVWDNIVLVGDAAHPTTPHGLRSTNMSILDAGVLGKCLEKEGQSLQLALAEYESIRRPVVSGQVLHARRLGRIKQGLPLYDGQPFDPSTASVENCQELQQKMAPHFTDIPELVAPILLQTKIE